LSQKFFWASKSKPQATQREAKATQREAKGLSESSKVGHSLKYFQAIKQNKK
jgi:hypothetical protein